MKKKLIGFRSCRGRHNMDGRAVLVQQDRTDDVLLHRTGNLLLTTYLVRDTNGLYAVHSFVGIGSVCPAPQLDTHKED